MGRCVGARAFGQDIPGPRRRGLGVMHFGVQAAMGPMALFGWFTCCATTYGYICHLCLYLARAQ